MTHEQFDENLDSMITEAKRIGAMEYQQKILSNLHDIDEACAAAGGAMISAHTPEEIHKRFRNGWANLKMHIRGIEMKGGNP